MGERNERDDDLAIGLVGAAVLAGAYAELAREFGGHGGMLKMSAKHSARVAALAGEICEREASMAAASRTPPGARRPQT